MFSVFFYNMRTVNLVTRESAALAVRECCIIWERARILIRAVQHCIDKLINLYNEWRNLQKKSKKVGESYRLKENDFKNKSNLLFDIAHSDALKLIKIDVDRQFSLNQRLPGRPGCLLEDKSSESSDSSELETNISLEIEPTPEKKKCRGKMNFITQKLAGALDRCQLSIRDSVYVLQATLEALKLNVKECVINQTSIHRSREIYRRERSELIKLRFKESVPNYVVVHWDGKLLPDTKIRNKTVERLPIVITNINKYNIGIEDQACGAALENVKEDIRNFVKSKLETKHSRGDYREFLELVLIFIGGNLESKITIYPPGAMHQARWMARAIYCLKIFLFRSQYNISDLSKKAIGEICVFIIKFYVKAWFTCPLPNKAPNQDLQFIKDMKLYEAFDREISRVSIQKLCNHLWYLTEETAALSFFDNSIPLEVLFSLTYPKLLTRYQGLLYKLKIINTPNYIFNIISEFLSNRQFSVKINDNYSDFVPITAGVPQGSILGPTLL
ncbi:hypothetical protein QTP88_003082 [Uroleucon formosanum]